MSEKIVQLNEEVIKGQIKELAERHLQILCKPPECGELNDLDVDLY